ncbi:MAG TPA: nitroreductase family deazaflavin-dependent oxidoreductase [Anaerolineales bacterium]
MPGIDFFVRLSNPFIKLILRSPLHRLISGNILLITYTGRRSGKPFTTPVNYMRSGDLLRVVSFRQRRWWRNLRNGAPVELRLAGQDLAAWAEVIEGCQEVAEELISMTTQNPAYGRFLNVSQEPAGTIDRDAARQSAESRVVVVIKPGKKSARVMQAGD